MTKRVILNCYCGETYSVKVNPDRTEVPRCPSCLNASTSLVLDLFKALERAERHEQEVKSLIEAINGTNQVTVSNAKDLNAFDWNN